MLDNRPVPGGGGSYVLPSIFSSPTSIPLDEMKNYAYTDNTGTERAKLLAYLALQFW
jgi:hypothetical protein